MHHKRVGAKFGLQLAIRTEILSGVAVALTGLIAADNLPEFESVAGNESLNLTCDKNEAKLLERLHAALAPADVRSAIDEIVERLEPTLSHSCPEVMAWEAVPLSTYRIEFPVNIQSSWVFILREHTPTGPERHPDSIQRVMSYRGDGNLRCKVNLGDAWCSNTLVSTAEAPMAQRWLSIPAGVWHEAVASDSHWAVVSFHTVAADKLIEERPDPNRRDATRRRTYTGR